MNLYSAYKRLLLILALSSVDTSLQDLVTWCENVFSASKGSNLLLSVFTSQNLLYY